MSVAHRNYLVCNGDANHSEYIETPKIRKEEVACDPSSLQNIPDEIVHIPVENAAWEPFGNPGFAV